MEGRGSDWPHPPARNRVNPGTSKFSFHSLPKNFQNVDSWPSKRTPKIMLMAKEHMNACFDLCVLNKKTIWRGMHRCILWSQLSTSNVCCACVRYVVALHFSIKFQASRTPFEVRCGKGIDFFWNRILPFFQKSSMIFYHNSIKISLFSSSKLVQINKKMEPQHVL